MAALVNPRAANPVLRVAGLADTSAIGGLLRESYPALMAPSYSKGLLDAFLPHITVPNENLLAAGTFFLAEVDGNCVACGGWSPHRPGTGGEIEPGLAHLRHFATLAKATRNGLGRALYNRCALEADVLGFSRFEVFASLNAEGFYHALGFRGMEQSALSFPGGLEIPAIRMIREI